MDDATKARIVEAGARASRSLSDFQWQRTPQELRAMWCNEFRACLSAALAAAEAEGVVLVRVPDAEEEPDWMASTPNGRDWADGHNACRAATLAGKVTL
jgi:nitrous oxide reductase accessory protein NosL